MVGLALWAFVLVGGMSGQTAPPPDPQQAVAPAPEDPARYVPVDTVVDIAITTTINSKANKIGDVFPIRLAEPVVGTSGDILIPAGTPGQGEVIHAARARAMGKAGELILAARYLQCGDTHVPLGHFRFGVSGKNNLGAAIAVSVVATPLVLFVAGGEVNVPPDTRAHARITTGLTMSAEMTRACAAGISSTHEGGKQ